MEEIIFFLGLMVMICFAWPIFFGKGGSSHSSTGPSSHATRRDIEDPPVRDYDFDDGDGDGG